VSLLNNTHSLSTFSTIHLIKTLYFSVPRYIVSDCDSVGVFYSNQHYAPTPEEAAADAIKAGQSLSLTTHIIYIKHLMQPTKFRSILFFPHVTGLDLDCGPFLAVHTQDAVKKGLLSEADVDGALVNTLTVQMRLGMFDGEPSAQEYGKLGPNDVCKPAHQQLALEAATQGIVLLKNTGPVLPLSQHRHRTVAVIGPNSKATVTMIGNYAGKVHLLP